MIEGGREQVGGGGVRQENVVTKISICTKMQNLADSN